MGAGVQVGIVVGVLTFWVCAMVLIGKWGDIRRRFRALLSRKTSVKDQA
jgi:hypothetical protein